MPPNRLACAAPASGPTVAFPLSCPADEGGRTPAEYDADGLYAIGPKRARPPLVRMIAEAAQTAPPDLARRAAEATIAAERTAYRQALPTYTRRAPLERSPRGFLRAIRGQA